MTDDPSTFFQDIRKELDSLKAENDSLKKEVTELKQKSTVEIDSELMEALAEFDSDMVLNGNQESAKKELVGLLDELESMIQSLNTGTGMGLKVPEQLNEIRNSLNTQ
jgi:uncharacterized coiled-coil DUF342 family protein